MRTDELAAHYRRYLQHLNDRLIHDLEDFVHERMVYNGEPKTRVEYQNLIAESVAAAPDLYFNIALLVVNDDHVACRLAFNCTPQREFLGLKVNGRSVSFVEHVFYRFSEGKIAQVWSLIDLKAIEAQLSA